MVSFRKEASVLISALSLLGFITSVAILEQNYILLGLMPCFVTRLMEFMPNCPKLSASFISPLF